MDSGNKNTSKGRFNLERSMSNVENFFWEALGLSLSKMECFLQVNVI